MKQQAQEEKDRLLKRIAELDKIIAEPDKPSKEERLLQLLNGAVLRIDKHKYPNSTFLFRGDDFLAEYNSKSVILWLSYPRIWSVFESEYGMKHNDIVAFTRGMVEEHFKCKVLSTGRHQHPRLALVEEHFKYKGVTTGIKESILTVYVGGAFQMQCSNIGKENK